ncbi:phage capsid scaffolding protein [Escherichia coli]|nr:phage capsid scaffolding protein [Escherichia coli]
MAKKNSKWFRIGVEGDTCDGRVISATDIRTWPTALTRASTAVALTSSISAALFPTARFCRYGDVTEVKAQVIDDDSALNGKLALFGKIAPLDNLLADAGERPEGFTPRWKFARTLPIPANVTSSGWR